MELHLLRCLKIFVLFSYVYSSIKTPDDFIKNIGEDVVFMWNTTDGKNILSSTWGLLSSNGDVKPAFIYISTRTSGPVFQADLDTTAVRYKGRVSWVGNITLGRAWFKITNLSLQDTNQYVAGIREHDQDEESKYSINLTVAEPPTTTASPSPTSTDGKSSSIPTQTPPQTPFSNATTPPSPPPKRLKAWKIGCIAGGALLGALSLGGATRYIIKKSKESHQDNLQADKKTNTEMIAANA